MDLTGLYNIAIFRLPYFVAYVVGIIYLSKLRRRSPRPCTWGIATLSVLLASDLISLAINLYWYAVAGRSGNLLWLMSFQGMAFNVLHVVGLLTLTIAIGLDRGQGWGQSGDERTN